MFFTQKPVMLPRMSITHHTITDDENDTRLDRILKRLGLLTGMARLVRTGQVRINGKRAALGDRVHTGDIIRVPLLGNTPLTPQPVAVAAPVLKAAPKPHGINAQAQINAMMLYEDADIMILNKPAGLATQGGSGIKQHVDGLLMGLARGDKRPVLVHRLDRDTSGCLVIAKKPGVAAAMGKLFMGRGVQKVYRALVRGVPPHGEGTIEVPLLKTMTPQGERVVASSGNPLAQRAHTDVQVLDTIGRAAAWLAMAPRTGRTHQLRVHAAYWGHGIVGDGKYGQLPRGETDALVGILSREDINTLHLHAHRLIFVHPNSGKTIDIVAPLPPHMQRSCKALGFSGQQTDTLHEKK